MLDIPIMKSILLASLLVPALAFADNSIAPRGPDFVAVRPARMVDRTVAVSDGMQPISPLELVLFDLNSTALDPMSIDQLDVLAKWMKKYPEQNLVIEGHTDRLGELDYNFDLGKRRAIAVRNHLASWGVNPDRVVLAVFGERGAHTKENPGDRRAVIFASDRPVRELVGKLMDHTIAYSVTWTDRGGTLEETHGMAATTASR